MKINAKNLPFLLSIICLMMSTSGNVYSQTASDIKPDQTGQYNSRITKESHAGNLSDSINLNPGEFFELDSTFLSNPDLQFGLFNNMDILTFKKEKNKINVFENNSENISYEDIGNKSITNDLSRSQIYDISLSSYRKSTGNSQTGIGITNKTTNNSSSGFSSTNNIKKPEANLQNILDQAKQQIQKKNPDQAEKLLDKAVGLANRNSWLLAEAANLYDQINKKNKAITAYEKAILINPDRIELLYSYSLCLYKNNQLDKAEKTLLKIISLNPKFMLAHYNLGNIYYKKAQYYKALSEFKESFRLNPLSADACYNLALTLEVLNQKILAKKYYAECLKLKPKDQQAQNALIRLGKS